MAEYSSYMWSVPDWRTDEMYTLLDNREQGIYRNLIDECWISRSIVNDIEVLARSSREPVEYFLSVWAKIRHKFKVVQGGSRLISTRLEQDRRRLMLNANFTHKRAKKAAETRWANERAEKELHASSTTQAMPKHDFKQCQTQTHTKGNVDSSPLPESSSFLSSPTLLQPETADASPPTKQGTTARRTRAPAELPITDSMRVWAEENGIAVDLGAETEQMLDSFRGKGETRLDWNATWRTWMRNTKKFKSANAIPRNGSTAHTVVPKPKPGKHQCIVCPVDHEWTCEDPDCQFEHTRFVWPCAKALAAHK